MKNKNRLALVIKFLALISLLAAFTAGQIIKQNNKSELIVNHFSKKVLTAIKDSNNIYAISNKPGEKPEGYVVVKTTDGWGGPAIVAVSFDLSGKLNSVDVLSHMETPVFFRHLVEQGFFNQFPGKKTLDKFKVGQDVDAISGATISSKAFTKACKMASFDLGTNVLKQALEPEKSPLQMGANEYALFILLGLILFCVYKKIHKARKYILAISAVFVGFYMAAPVAISNIGSLLLGYWPNFSNHVFWWTIILAAILPPLLLGKNYYCFWFCPFGGMQEIIFSLAGFKIKLNKKLIKYAGYLASFLLWLSLMIIFLSTNPSKGMFEPFATLFSFKGSAVQWYLVSLTVFASFLMPRFWCRFFCPVGAFLGQLVKLNKKAAGILKREKNDQTK